MGIVFGLIVILIVAVVAHWPAAGVKVYNGVPTLLVFIVAGDHVPVIPFIDVSGKVPGIAFRQ